MPLIDQKDKISVKADPEISKADLDNKKLHDFFQKKLSELKRQKAVIKK